MFPERNKVVRQGINLCPECGKAKVMPEVETYVPMLLRRPNSLSRSIL